METEAIDRWENNKSRVLVEILELGHSGLGQLSQGRARYCQKNLEKLLRGNARLAIVGGFEWAISMANHACCAKLEGSAPYPLAMQGCE